MTSTPPVVPRETAQKPNAPPAYSSIVIEACKFGTKAGFAIFAVCWVVGFGTWLAFGRGSK